MHEDDSQYPISVVEQETGISKELLRMWERRYEFPIPARDTSGNRMYSRAQIDRLQDINKLLAAGYRPGFVVGAKEEKLQQLLQELPSAATAESNGAAPRQLDALLELIQHHEFADYRRQLRQELASEGVRQFVLGIAAPLQQDLARAELGDALPAFTCQLARQILLETLQFAATLLPLPNANGLQILLIDLPGDNRPLELLMIRTLLLSSGADVLFLGTEPPVDDVIECLRHCSTSVLQIAVSAAAVTPSNRQLVARLRAEMPAQTTLWLSGSGAEDIAEPSNEPVFRRLHDLLQAVQAWQNPLRET